MYVDSTLLLQEAGTVTVDATNGANVIDLGVSYNDQLLNLGMGSKLAFVASVADYSAPCTMTFVTSASSDLSTPTTITTIVTSADGQYEAIIPSNVELKRYIGVSFTGVNTGTAAIFLTPAGMVQNYKNYETATVVV